MELVRLAALLIAAGSALAAVLGLGGAASDRLDILNHFAPFYLAGGVVALLPRLIDRSGGGGATLCLAAVAIVVSAALMGPDLLAAVARAPPPPTGETLKLIQFNVWEHNRDPAGTARWVASQNADIVVMEEAAKQGGEVADALSPLYPFRSVGVQPGRSYSIILSKTAPTAGGDLRAGPAGPVLGAWASFGAGASPFTVVGTHALWPLPPGPQQAQSRLLAAALGRFDRASLIVMGDFNSTPWSFSLRREDARLAIERRTRALFTWPAAAQTRYHLVAPFPFLAIDQVYAGKVWRTVSVHRGPRLGSDHYPVIVTLRRPAEG